MGTRAGLEGNLEWPVQDLEREYYRKEGLGRLKALPVFLMSSGEMWKLSLAGPLSPLAPNPTACACSSCPSFISKCALVTCLSKEASQTEVAGKKNKQHF